MIQRLKKVKIMNFDSLKKIKEESTRVKTLYEIFDEDQRLNRSKAARVEFLTTVKYLDGHLKEDANILDIGCGTGEYSLYYAKMGYQVAA